MIMFLTSAFLLIEENNFQLNQPVDD